jgi:LPXTG-motif cell wall-anchored protein
VASSSTEQSFSSSDGDVEGTGADRGAVGGVVVVAASDGQLPRTGTQSGTLLMVGGMLVVAGLLLVRYTRRQDA